MPTFSHFAIRRRMRLSAIRCSRKRIVHEWAMASKEAVIHYPPPRHIELLAACLTGQPIDMGGSQFEVIEKRRVLPNLAAVDPRLRPLIERMLQPDPKDRPESMAAVAAWRPKAGSRPPARPAASGRSGQKTPQRAADTAPQMPSRAARRLLLGTLALVLLLGVGSVGFYLAQDIVAIAPPPGGPPTEPPPLTPDDMAAPRRAEDERRAAAEAEAKKRADEDANN